MIMVTNTEPSINGSGVPPTAGGSTGSTATSKNPSNNRPTPTEPISCSVDSVGHHFSAATSSSAAAAAAAGVEFVGQQPFTRNGRRKNSSCTSYTSGPASPNSLPNNNNGQQTGTIGSAGSSPASSSNVSMTTSPMQNSFTERILNTLKTLGCTGPIDSSNWNAMIKTATKQFALRWKLKDDMSEVAFKGLLFILEQCLSSELHTTEGFEEFVQALGYHTVFFWKKAVPILYDSDMQHGTNYRDALLFSLTLYDVNKGQNRLRELFAAVPGLRDSFLGKHAKRFEEAFHNIIARRNSFVHLSSRNSEFGGDMADLNVQDLEDDAFSTNSSGDDSSSYRDSGIGTHNYHRDDTPVLETVAEEQTTIVGGGLSTHHLPKRVINVSNAPPVSLKKGDTGEWEVAQGSGGLVTCVQPVMCQNKSNVWLACFGPNVKLGSRSESPLTAPVTNSLGLPLMQQTRSEVLSNVLRTSYDDDDKLKNEVEDQMSLIGVLSNYNKGNSYKLNPVVVQEEDYNTYYGGISNGLLWPACHGLAEYIVSDYETPEILAEHWMSYVRVNYQFAINAVRNSRPQDFIWIHDYHLMLTGMIMQSLDPNLEVGFFLHIPFQPPQEFMDKHGFVLMAILRGLLKFTKVGFQTHRDLDTFLDLVRTHLCTAKIKYDPKVESYSVYHDGCTASLGVFPVSVKNEAFLSLANDKEIIDEAQAYRAELRKSMHEDSRIFFSVERFDYTKGIAEKIKAWRLFLERHPERWGRDVLVQVAVTNRRGVDTYRIYQDRVIEEAERINEDFKCPEFPDWKPIHFLTNGLPRPKLVSRYLAMDIGVVTPKKDGMNLVAKEMVLCNPEAGLMLSCGAGTETQLSAAGFYTEGGLKAYHRVADVTDIEQYAQAFYEAAIQPLEVRRAHGERLKEFIFEHDIEKWSEAFLDPKWTHHCIQPSTIVTLTDFYSMMFQTRNIRRQITERILKGHPISSHFAISLKHAKESLEECPSREAESTILKLKSDDRGQHTLSLDVRDEIEELEKDLAFLEIVQNDDFDNIDQFLTTLEKYHPDSAEQYREEVEEVITLISRGDHFHYFFTDRDGTLKSYSCSYGSSIQPSYSGVIQATFAHRCTQYSAILTSAPLLNLGILDVNVMPDGYFSFGASGGREWYIEASQKFKDNSIPDTDLELLDILAARIQQLLNDKPEFTHLAWLGSGLQKHYGHITVAKQDCYNSVDAELSELWFEEVRKLVEELDHEGDSTQQLLTIKDTGNDIKIYLKRCSDEAAAQSAIFNKGHGIKLFSEHMGLNFKDGNILVCGDSESDLSTLQECLKINPKNTYTVWVTQNPVLQHKVTKMCTEVDNSNFVFVSCPGVILGAMAQATIREIQLRPTGISNDYQD